MKTLIYVAVLGSIAAFATGHFWTGVWAAALAIMAFLIYCDDRTRRLHSGSDDPETRAFWERLAEKWRRDD